MTIGFLPADYTVREDAGTVTLSIQVLDGTLGRAVQVDFSTIDGTATSSQPVDYFAPEVPIILQFTPDELVQQVTITIRNDEVTESSEMFFGNLVTMDTAVYLAPPRANVEITDDDGECILYWISLFYLILIIINFYV